MREYRCIESAPEGSIAEFFSGAVSGTLMRIGRGLSLLGESESAEQYAAMSCKAAAAVFVCVWLVWSLLSKGVAEGIVLSSLVSALSLYYLLGAPERRLEERARKVEKELPFALMQLSVDLNIGVPFGEAMGKIAKCGYGQLSVLLNDSMRASRRSGGSVPGAIFRAAELSGSREFRRSAMQLAAVYEHGAKNSAGEDVRKIALELLAKQKAAAKEFSAKIVAISMAFIVVSTVVPALFQAFVTVGASFMEIPLNGAGVLAASALLFPLIDAALLLYMRSLTPEFLK